MCTYNNILLYKFDNLKTIESLREIDIIDENKELCSSENTNDDAFAKEPKLIIKKNK